MESQFDSRTIDLLRDLFEQTGNKPEGVSDKKFRIRHRDDWQLLDKLDNKRLIDHDYTTSTYRIRIAGLLLVNNKKSQDLFSDMNKICTLLRSIYIDNHDKDVLITHIETQLQLDKLRVIECLNFLQDTPARCGGTTDQHADNATIYPSEGLLNFDRAEEAASDIIKSNFPDLFVDETNNNEPHGNTIINAHKREAVLGAALAVLAAFPEKCQADTGKAKGAKIAKQIEEMIVSLPRD